MSPAASEPELLDVRRLEEMLRRINAAENDGNVAQITGMLADDVVIMAPNQPVQEGKAACAAFLSGVLPALLDDR